MKSAPELRPELRVDPSGESCNYDHRKTKMGGRITKDVTDGYGPEMFFLRRAAPGSYVVSANMYSSDARRLSTGTRVWLTTIEYFGRPSERVRHQQIRIGDARKVVQLAQVARPSR